MNFIKLLVRRLAIRVGNLWYSVHYNPVYGIRCIPLQQFHYTLAYDHIIYDERRCMETVTHNHLHYSEQGTAQPDRPLPRATPRMP